MMQAHQWPICTWRGLTPRMHHGSWKAFRRNSAAHWTAHYQASLYCSVLNYNFLPWRFSLLDPHVKIHAVWGEIWNVWPTCCSKATQAAFPPPVLPLYDFYLCQWWRLIEHQEGERTFYKTAGGKGLPIIFLLVTFRMHRFLLAVPLVLCP